MPIVDTNSQRSKEKSVICARRVYVVYHISDIVKKKKMSVYSYIFLVYLDAITSSVPLQQILLIFTGTPTVQVLLPISSLKNDFCGSDNLSEDMIKSSPVFVQYVRK